ncbi:MAG: glycosyltransferase [Bacteroidetes bacterium]|nr:glycosyltransferase [Bacteroidota bacterium]
MKKTKILRIVNRFNLGGITYNVTYLSKYLPEYYETKLIGGPEEKFEQNSLYIPQQVGLEPEIIFEMRRSIYPLQDFIAYRRIRQIIKEFKPDIVHTHASKAGFIGRLAAIHSGVPVVVHTFHGHVFNGYFSILKTTIFKWIERHLAKKTSMIVAISQLQKIDLSKIHKICVADKIKVIPLGFDLEKFAENQLNKRATFRSTHQLRPNELAIGIIGRLAPIKNHFMFLNSIIKLKQSTDIPFKALIIGDGEMRESLENYLNQRHISFNQPNSYIQFVGWVKEVDIGLAGLDLVCLTSNNEGTPVSLIEAQAAGKYIITTNVGGVQDILEESAGKLVEPGDEDMFALQLLEAVTNFKVYQNKALIG